METALFGLSLTRWVIYWIRSFLEVLLIFCFNNAIAGQNRLPIKKLFALGLGISLIVLGYDVFSLPFAPLVMLFLCPLGLKIVSKGKFSELLSNLIFGVTATFIWELITHVIIVFTGLGAYTENDAIITVFSLMVAVIAVNVIYSNQNLFKKLKIEIELRRHVILMVFMSMAVPIVMLSDLFLNSDSLFFWNNYYGAAVSVVLYFVLNLYLFKYFRDYMRKENEVQTLREYGDYMKEAANILNRREHEHKNQLNVIIGIAEMEGPEYRQKIISYAEELIGQYKKQKPIGHVISDNSVIAAYIYKYARFAESRGIIFDYYVAKPFPDYRLPETVLLELLANLLNNAFEAVENLPSEKKAVSLYLRKGAIEITNNVDVDFSKGMVQSRQMQGFSTKGKHRGYGMANITDIRSRYGIQMETYLKEDMLSLELRF